MSLSAIAIITLSAPSSGVVCQTELPRGATKAKLLYKPVPGGDLFEIDAPKLTGKVEACVEVGVDGKVKTCTAYGSDVNTNTYTCKTVAMRFNYRPAKDRHRNPIGSFVIQKFTWTVGKE